MCVDEINTLPAKPAPDSRWLLDGVLSYTSPMSVQQKPSLGPFKRFIQKIPTWIISLVLVAVGAALLYFKHATWCWIDIVPFVREVFPAIGDALIVAGVLALAVDPFLKAKLLDEFARDIFEHLIGFDHEPEIRAELKKLAFDTNLYQRDYDLRCEIEERPEGGVIIKASKQLGVFNQSLEDRAFTPGWQFAQPDNARECRVTYFIDEEEDRAFTPLFVETAGGYSEALTDKVKIAPQYKGKRFRFRAECVFEAPEDWYHPMYFGLPTIGITISVTAPQGWAVWVGKQSDPSNRADFHEKRLYMPGDKIEIHWRKPRAM